jgi:hypothetical protein
VECYEGTVQAKAPFESPLLHPGLGQYAVGGSGFGWSLGSYGGYEVWRVSHQSTYQITGNPMTNWGEPGIVWIQEDRNGNEVPDEMWYELKGSEDSNQYRHLVARRYAVTYIDAGDTEIYTTDYGTGIILYPHVYWVDSKGRAALLPSKWPAWYPSRVTFTTTLIRDLGRGPRRPVGLCGHPLRRWELSRECLPHKPGHARGRFPP